ncbi:hypothetical protein BGZ94_005513, partial [Podila epigama]
TTLLGSISRQTVSKQLLPLSNSKHSAITLTQRTAQPVNTPANPVRSFSSSQTRENSPNPAGGASLHHHHHSYHHPQIPHLGGSNPNFGAQHRLQHALGNAPFYYSADSPQPPQALNKNPTYDENSAIPLYSELARIAWDAINGQDARAVFPCLQEMRHHGVYANSALSSRIIGQFLDMGAPQDAERALSLLVECHRSQGRSLSAAQIDTYSALAREIADYSSDFAQTLSLAKLLDR